MTSLSSEELEVMRNRFKKVCNVDIDRKQTEDFFIQSILNEASINQTQLDNLDNLDNLQNLQNLINKLDEDIQINQDDKLKINKKLEDISIIKS